MRRGDQPCCSLLEPHPIPTLAREGKGYPHPPPAPGRERGKPSERIARKCLSERKSPEADHSPGLLDHFSRRLVNYG